MRPGTFLFALLFTVCAVQAGADEKKVTLANIEYPPFAGKKLKHGGFLTEIATQAFKREGYTVDYKYVPWARGLKGTKEGAYDGLCVAWYRPEREQWFIFSKPMPASEIVFFKRKGADISFSGDYEALKPYSIGVVRGYVNPPGFDKVKHKLKIEEVRTDLLNIRKLIRERLDLILIDRFVGKYLISTEMIGFSDTVEVLEPTLKKDINHIMFSKAVDNIQIKVEAFNKGMDALEKEDAVDEILSKHGF